MAAHRYWRLRAVDPYSGIALELSEVQLLSATARVDAGVALTASIAPTTGSLAMLQDDAATGSVQWVDSRGLTLTWDFGVATDVTNIRFGSGVDGTKFPFSALLQWSDDGAVWFEHWLFMRIAWPGANALTASSASGTALRASGIAVQSDALVGTTITLTPPAALPGDLLLASVVRRSAATTLPDGWTLLRTSAEATNGTASQWLDVYTKTATGSDAAVTFGQVSSGRIAGHIIALQGNGSPPVLELAASNVTADEAGPPNGLTRLLQLTSPGKGRIGVAVVARIVAETSGSSPMNVQGGGWADQTQFVSEGGKRLMVATLPLLAGQATTDGSAIVQGSLATDPNTTQWLQHMMIFAGPAHISESFAISRTPTERSVAIIGSPPPSVYGQPVLNGSIVARYNFIVGGNGRVRGTVKEDSTPTDIPLRRLVRLYRERDGMLMREQWSDATTGAYDFKDVELGEKYTVLAYDYPHNYRAVAADNLAPEAMQ